MAAIQGLVQDESNDVSSISIYNFPLGKADCKDVFYKDVVIYLKEPFYKTRSTPRLLNLRVDSPEDIIFEKDVQSTSPLDVLKFK